MLRFWVLGRQFRHVSVFKISRRHTSKMQQCTRISKISPEQCNMLGRTKHMPRLKTGDPRFCCTACYSYLLVSHSTAQKNRTWYSSHLPIFPRMFLEVDIHLTSAFTLEYFKELVCFAVTLYIGLHTDNTHSAIIRSSHVFVRPQGQLRPFVVVYPPPHVVQVLKEEWGDYKPTQEQEKTFIIGERGEQHNKFF